MDAIKLIVSIVERGKGVAMQRLYDQRQVFLHLQCAGRGTATSEILDILGLGSSEKDVVFSFAAAPSAQLLLHDLDNDLRGSAGTSGIVFSLPLTGLNNLAAALVDFRASAGKKGNGGDAPMEHSAESTLILVACARGYSDAVMATAKAQGPGAAPSLRAACPALRIWSRPTAWSSMPSGRSWPLWSPRTAALPSWRR